MKYHAKVRLISIQAEGDDEAVRGILSSFAQAIGSALSKPAARKQLAARSKRKTTASEKGEG